MILFLVIVAITALTQLVPIWWIALPFVATAAYLLGKSARQTAWAGAAGTGLVWLVWTGYINQANDGILANRVAGVFGLSSGWLLVVVAAVVAALLGGLAAWSGYLLKRALSSEPTTAG